MRFYEIINGPRVTAPKQPEDQQREVEQRAKAGAAIAKARSRTLKAAQVYSDRREADDDAEREAKKTLAGR